MTDTAKQGGDCADEVYAYVCHWLRQFVSEDTPQAPLDPDAIRAIIDKHDAALREEVERLRSIVKQLPEFIDHIGSSIYDWERVAQELREAALREGRQE